MAHPTNPRHRSSSYRLSVYLLVVQYSSHATSTKKCDSLSFSLAFVRLLFWTLPPPVRQSAVSVHPTGPPTSLPFAELVRRCSTPPLVDYASALPKRPRQKRLPSPTSNPTSKALGDQNGQKSTSTRRRGRLNRCAHSTHQTPIHMNSPTEYAVACIMYFLRSFLGFAFGPLSPTGGSEERTTNKHTNLSTGFFVRFCVHVTPGARYPTITL